MHTRSDAWLVDMRWFKAYPLGEDTTIGRGDKSTIILRDAAVSRLHAEVKKEADAYVLHASGVSGTKVNGMPVTAVCTLREGDVVEIAYSKLRFTTKAPTNEMFVVSRDTPTPADTQEGPTLATLRAASRAAILHASKRRWHLLAVAVLIAAILLFLVG